MARQPTREEVLLTNGAVAHVLATFCKFSIGIGEQFARETRVMRALTAIMIFEQERVYAHPAIIAVTKVLSTTDSAEAALLAMVWLILCRHPQVADLAMILSKPHTAVHANIPAGHLDCQSTELSERSPDSRFARLSCVTDSTYDLGD